MHLNGKKSMDPYSWKLSIEYRKNRGEKGKEIN
jgi:hypothetical protein